MWLLETTLARTPANWSAPGRRPSAPAAWARSTASESRKSAWTPGWRNTLPRKRAYCRRLSERTALKPWRGNGGLPGSWATALCVRRGFLPGIQMQSIAPASAENEAAGGASSFVVRLSQLSAFARLRISSLQRLGLRPRRVGSTFSTNPVKPAPNETCSKSLTINLGRVMQRAVCGFANGRFVPLLEIKRAP